MNRFMATLGQSMRLAGVPKIELKLNALLTLNMFL